MEEITKLCDCMPLTAKEGGRVDLSDSLEDSGGLLAAKFLTKRVVNLEAIMRTLKPIWWSVQGFTGRDMGNNRVMFRFTDAADMERVLVNGPWSFDKYLILLKRIEDDQSFSHVEFDSCSFWVQIHDLPVRCMNSGVCEKIGKTLGRVEQVEDFAEGRGSGNYMRVRVNLDVMQPLCRGRKIWLGGDQDHWVSFKFERLPIFCYWCGHISHDDRDCAIWLNSHGCLSPDKQEYGPWLHGELPRLSRRDWSSKGAPTRDSSSSKTRGETTPVLNSGKVGQDNLSKVILEITPSPKLVTETLDFQARLKEIDRELGLEHGEINESVELLLQGDSQLKFQMTKAGVLRAETNRIGLEVEDPIGPQDNGPIVDLCGPKRPTRKNTGSKWKRITRNTMESVCMAQQSPLPQHKRNQITLPEEELVRSLKKTKADGHSATTNEV